MQTLLAEQVPAATAAGPRAAGAPLLSVRGLVKRYGATEVVRQLDFDILPGECHGIIGPNGAGKTTTIRLCLGLAAPDAGRIELMGLPVPSEAARARMRVGVVTQFDSLDPDFTVRENLMVYGRYFGMSDAQTRQRIPALLQFAALEHKADARIQELSGGMKRRLSLARALIHDPALIFLDEPTTGLDPQARHLIWDRLKSLLAQGKSILLTTHFMDEAERLCARVLVLDHGRRLDEDTPLALIQRHVEPRVIEVYGALVDRAQALATPLAERVERSGDTLFAYAHAPEPVLEALGALGDGVRVLHRPANLEDVFLKLTGRQLRD
ncbi:MAG: ATP-binding cassette domain-containing protein [Betaproteobacteria bacterium]|nr:ATP-binding cassette domain-containing protein [Betaproteobacteria bacterium]MBU6512991.1 ATP-binding cassette domain-containing protein [Betaproteobacteria bacterium]MDE1956259.1 ATP-binding cassette domain-containing protein [Betaproteobacteria bacterium]MDE2153519.1 ATP-binding cassette domain-containing protein [Betaproteobacteria bacterium]